MCNAERYTSDMPQLVARIPKELLALIEEAVSSGEFETRSDVVRAALAELFDRRRREAIGRAIVEGYERMPLTEREIEFAERAARLMIEEEPW